MNLSADSAEVAGTASARPAAQRFWTTHYFVASAARASSACARRATSLSAWLNNYSADIAGSVGASRAWYLCENEISGRGKYGKIKQTLRGSFSAVSKPNFASKYSLESS